MYRFYKEGDSSFLSPRITTFFNNILEIHFSDEYVIPCYKVHAMLMHLDANFNRYPRGYVKTGFVLVIQNRSYFSMKEPIIYV